MKTTTLLAALVAFVFVLPVSPSMACQSLECQENLARLLKAPPKKGKCPRCNLYHAVIRGVRLHEADLRGVDLRGADLRDVSFHLANLRGAMLINAKLDGVHFSYADLRGADLRYTVLRGANLAGANLTGAKMPSNLTGVRFCNTTMPDGKVRNPSKRPYCY